MDSKSIPPYTLFFPERLAWKNVFHQNKEKEEADLDPEIGERTDTGGRREYPEGW